MVKTIINRKLVEVDEKELVNKLVRHAFIVAKDGAVHFIPIGDRTTTYEYSLENGLCANRDDYESLIRGAYDQHGIYLFKGSDYTIVKVTGELQPTIREVYKKYIEVFDYTYTDIAVWSGMVIGAVGTLWRPRLLLGAIKPTGQLVEIRS